MKKSFKKSIALLVAGVLLTTSAAAYAAQLPNKNADSLAISSSSQQELFANISMQSYQLTPNRLTINLLATPSIGQFRYTWYTVSIQKENGVGTSDFVPVGEGSFTQNGPNNFRIDEALTIMPGERVFIQVSVTGEAFESSYIGSAYGSEDYYLTL